MESGHLAVGLLAFALFAPTGAAAPMIDQIDNGGFEDGLEQWRAVDGDVGTTSESYEGDHAAQLNAVGDTTTTTLAQEVSLDNEDAPIVPNAEYEITFAADLNTGTATPSTSPPDAYGQIVWKNALGETSRVDQVSIADSADFVEYSETFDAPEDASAADVQFHLVRENPDERTDSNLKVDAVAFGPADPTEGATETSNGPPCSDDGTVAEVGPVHVYREGFFCEPRVDVDEDWEPSDGL